MKRKSEAGVRNEAKQDAGVVAPEAAEAQKGSELMLAEQVQHTVEAAQGSSPEASPAEFGAMLEQLSHSESIKAALVRQLQHRYGNRYVRRVLQSKARTSQPSDAHEQQADRMAERVMRADKTDAAQTDGETRSSSSTHADTPLARKATPALSQSFAASTDAVADASPVVGETLRAPGQPLNASTRNFMEARFAEDFGDVRVHTDERAARSAQELEANAYTVGRDIVFAEGRYSPQTDAGRELIAHELAHVVQQGTGAAELSVIQRQPASGAGGAGGAGASSERDQGAQGASPGVALPPVPEPLPDPTPEEKRAELLSRSYQSDEERFAMNYDPGTGQGSAHVSIFVHVDFQPFTPQMMTEEPYAEYYKTHKPPDPKDCVWTKAQEAKFTDDLVASVGGAWSRKHTLFCAEPGLEDVSASLDVEVMPIDSADAAHVKVVAQKTPPATPRYPAHRKKGEATAHLDWRDPTEPGKLEGQKAHMQTAQIAPFEPGKATLTKELEQQVGAILGGPLAWQYGLVRPETIKEIILTGWASTTSNSEMEDAELAYKRAQSVKAALRGTVLDFEPITLARAGRQNAKPEPRYQRVVVEVVAQDDAFSQNVAAHEFGHLFAGLGDEYTDPYRADGLPGDKPAHYERVREQLGELAAKELLVGNNANIMSGGNLVRPGHYITFVEVMGKMTGLRWKVK
ncbi:MAG TPA: DUF4157 domain-containing protein [Pyrinomonadaceae bacterium]|jgi:hypothetical protein